MRNLKGKSIMDSAAELKSEDLTELLSSVEEREYQKRIKSIRKFLEMPVSFEFINTPLQEALAQLEKQTGAEFVVDEKGMDYDGGIMLKVEDMPLKTALKWILSFGGLSHLTEQDGSIFISSQEGIWRNEEALEAKTPTGKLRAVSRPNNFGSL